LRLRLILPTLALALAACTTRAREAWPLATATLTPTPAAIAATPTPAWATVAAWALHVRACPGVSCSVVAWLRQGDRVVLMGRPVATEDGGTWVAVRTPAGLTGWVNRNFLTLGERP